MEEESLNALASEDMRYCGRSLLPQDLVYVPKAVELNGLFTVKEHIELIGCLRCVDLLGLKERIEGVYETLQLKDKLHLKCSELSAGEVKQVGVCIGIVVDPRILVLDEPTCGLDSHTAQTIVNQLLLLAKSNQIAVLMTIHQPSTALFNALEDLMLLEGGRMAYYGPLHDAKRFFGALGHQCPSVFSPADFYVDLIYRKPFDDLDVTWKDLYLSFNIAGLISAKDGEEIIETSADEGGQPLEFRRNLFYLLHYFFGLYNKDFRFYGVRILFMLCNGVYLGTLFLRAHRDVSDIRLIGGAAAWVAIMTVLSGFFATTAMCDERKFAAELVKNSVISPVAYCVALLGASLPYNLAASLVFHSIFHWMFFFSLDITVYIYSVLTMFLELLFIDSTYLVTIELLRIPILCLTVNVLIMAPLAFLCGFWVNVSDMGQWLSWLSYAMPTKYAYDSYMYEFIGRYSFESGSDGIGV
eukprot:gene9661-12395_t